MHSGETMGIARAAAVGFRAGFSEYFRQRQFSAFSPGKNALRGCKNH